MAQKSSSISFEDFADATLGSIVRAIEAHKNIDNPLIRNPHILIGIVWAPQLPTFDASGRTMKG